MLAMMNFVMSNDRIAACSNLDSSKCIAMDVVELDQTPPLAEYIHSTLVAIVDFIFSKKIEEIVRKFRKIQQKRESII